MAPCPHRQLHVTKKTLDSEPGKEQVFVTNDSGKQSNKRQFEQELMRIRKVPGGEEAAAAQGHENGFCINSLTGQTFIYKGQLFTPEQVSRYYLDLKDPSSIPYLSPVHSHF
jgi:glutamate synthase domain-containing protein 1